MNFGEYQDGTRQTWRKNQTVEPGDPELLNAVLGLVGESGELADLVKKHIFHGVPSDTVKVLKELGDVLYYVTRVAEWHGFTLEQVAQVNHDKLAARYPGGFVPGGGIRHGE